MNKTQPSKLSVESVKLMKGRHPRPLALTAYDYPSARLLDQTGVEILHVGDSLGMMVLGYPDTTHVTMDEMLHHLRAVSRAQPCALVTADLPFQTYCTPEKAVTNSRLLMDAGADAVKMEGGSEISESIRAVHSEGIPVQGHLGMLPQQVLSEGGYKRKGKTGEEQSRLLEDALLLESLGCFSLVLECVVPEVAALLTVRTGIPTFGIASGMVCDGEIRVTHDLLGAFPWFQPPHTKPYDNLAERTLCAIESFKLEALS